MRVLGNNIRLSATDLSHHLACRHVTALDLGVARGERAAPDWAAPDLVVIQERGRRHEAAYLEFLQNEKKLRISNLSEIREDRAALQETLRLMQAGAEVIAQGALGNAEWFGRPDVLRRVDSPAGNWAWSYEVADTKLSRETKGATILQLSLYSELLEVAQGCAAESMWVVPPGQGFEGERYRVAEYAAYFRYVKDRLARAAANGDGTATYPEPVEHCNVCRWFRECDERRRLDDHLSLVAGIRRQQRGQLEEWRVDTMAALAVLPIPLAQRPRHGSREGIEHVREQARVQVEGRTQKKLIRELLPLAEGIGLARLPEPSAGDVFLDLEGDPFVGEPGLQYLFGFAERGVDGELRYEKRWALNRAEEKAAFEWLVDEIMRRREIDPRLHVYHFGAYEPGALKRLMGLYATREDEIDRLLRAGAFVDLHQAFKQAVRASVEEYSLKKLEAFFAFERHTSLDESRKAMRFIEHSLELERNLEKIPDHIRAAMEGYNAEDCFSAAKLRDWLETQRDLWLKRGAGIPRPPERDGAPSEELDERQKRIAALVSRLTRGIPEAAGERSETQQACWLLAQLLDWHRRENKASWWEGFRLADLDPDDLLEERAGLSGLRFLERLQVDRKIPTDRYQFDEQETEAREERKLYHKGEAFGSVIAIDFAKRIIDVKKTRKSADLHPAAVYVWDRPYEVAAHEESLCRVAGWVAENGLDAPGNYRAARDLLLRRPPRLLRSETLAPLPGEAPKDTACRIGCALDHSVFAIQGPPGAGKTFTGARMICELVKQGKKIGITALSHKVIRKLLDEVVAAASESGQPIRCMQKTEDCEPAPQIAIAQDNDSAWGALARGQVHVLGGTSWLWSPEAAFESVDVLFIDEAGQMALADVLAVSQAAKSLVLIGDPQQLERPLKGSHPEGAEKSALEHLLRGEKTIPGDLGFLLPETWRLHPNICEFTSETFYEGRLASRDLLRNRVLQGHPHFHGAGLWFVPVEHSANRNSAPEEVELIAKIVDGLLRPEVQWFYGIDRSRRLDRQKDILVVAPYNAQVAVLSERLPGVKVGTVDKFQGQEAPVVIYSLTTSTPEDAPRGMEFLYSLNRLNVATSRAITAVILVGNSSLFEPQCLTPRQMQLANALCRYRELATVISPNQL